MEGRKIMKTHIKATIYTEHNKYRSMINIDEYYKLLRKALRIETIKGNIKLMFEQTTIYFEF